MISVIIPVHNRPALVGRAIRSALAQSWSDFSIYVVDDGSTDDTALRVTREFGDKVTLLSFAHNRGVSAARNLGIRESSGEWVAFLDSDDEWMPEKVERQLRALAAAGGMVCHTNERWIRNGVRVNQHKHHKKQGGDIFLQALDLCAMSPSSVVIHRAVLDEVGGFDERLPACEDYELFLRLTSRMPVTYLDEELLVKYGGHPDQLSRAHPAMDRFRVYALDKLLRSGCLVDRDRVDAAKATLVKKANIVLRGARRRKNGELAQSMCSYLECWS